MQTLHQTPRDKLSSEVGGAGRLISTTNAYCQSPSKRVCKKCRSFNMSSNFAVDFICSANASKESRDMMLLLMLHMSHKTLEMPCGSNELAFSMIFSESPSNSSRGLRFLIGAKCVRWITRQSCLHVPQREGSRLKCLPLIETSLAVH